MSNAPTTPYHVKYFAHDLTRQGASGLDRLSMSLFDASVDLNPHQIEAALFALQSPLSKGVILADEVGLGKGCIGLSRAIAKFEVERFNSFSTYAWAWIYNGIQRFVADNVLPLRLPAYLFPEYMRFRRELRACKEPGDEAAVMERWHRDNPRLLSRMLRVHAVILGVPLHLLETGEHPFALDAEHGETPDWKSLCLDAIRGLHERERIVIVKRYGLFGCPELTLQQVADELQLTRERVRQIQEKAERKLRRHCNRIRYLVDLMGQPDDAEAPNED